MNASLIPLAILVIFTIALVVFGRRDQARRPSRANESSGDGKKVRKPRPTSPLSALMSERRKASKQQKETCERIRRSIADSVPVAEKLDDSLFPGHVVLVHDLWQADDFTLRNRAVGLGWLPFVDPPEHIETDETAEARLARNYELNGTERQTIDDITDSRFGVIAVTAGHIAARIHDYPAWQIPFFTDHGVRIDLARTVTEFTESSVELTKQQDILGPTPTGELAKDPEVVRVYLEKARALERRAEGLLDLLTAFDEYRTVVGRIQVRHDKQELLRRMDQIDEFEHAVGAEVDRLNSDELRSTANESDMLASVYLDTLAPLTAAFDATD